MLRPAPASVTEVAGIRLIGDDLSARRHSVALGSRYGDVGVPTAADLDGYECQGDPDNGAGDQQRDGFHGASIARSRAEDDDGT